MNCSTRGTKEWLVCLLASLVSWFRSVTSLLSVDFLSFIVSIPWLCSVDAAAAARRLFSGCVFIVYVVSVVHVVK